MRWHANFMRQTRIATSVNSAVLRQKHNILYCPSSITGLPESFQIQLGGETFPSFLDRLSSCGVPVNGSDMRSIENLWGRPGHDSSINSVGCSDSIVACAGVGLTLKTWSSKRPSCCPVYEKLDAQKNVAALAFSPDGDCVFTAADGGIFTKCRASDGATIYEKILSETQIRALAVHPDGESVFLGCDGGHLIRLSANSGEAEGYAAFDAASEVEGAGAGVALAVCPLGKFVFTASASGIMKYSVDGGVPLYEKSLSETSNGRALALSSDGTYLYTADDGGTFLKLLADSGEPLSVFRTMPTDWLSTQIVICKSLHVIYDKKKALRALGDPTVNGGGLRACGGMCWHCELPGAAKDPNVYYCCPPCLRVGNSKPYNLKVGTVCKNVKVSTMKCPCTQCQLTAEAGDSTSNLGDFYNDQGEHVMKKSRTSAFKVRDPYKSGFDTVRGKLLAVKKGNAAPSREAVVDQQLQFINGSLSALAAFHGAAGILSLYLPQLKTGLREPGSKSDLKSAVVPVTMIPNALGKGRDASRIFSNYPLAKDKCGVLPWAEKMLTQKFEKMSDLRISAASIGRPPTITRETWVPFASDKAKATYTHPTSLEDVSKYIVLSSENVASSHKENGLHTEAAIHAFAYICKDLEKAKVYVFDYVARTIKDLYKVSLGFAMEYLQMLQLHLLQDHAERDYLSNLPLRKKPSAAQRKDASKSRRSRPKASLKRKGMLAMEEMDDALSNALLKNKITDAVVQVLLDHGLFTIPSVLAMLKGTDSINMSIKTKIQMFISPLFTAVSDAVDGASGASVMIKRAKQGATFGAMTVMEAIERQAGVVAGGSGADGLGSVDEVRVRVLQTFNDEFLATQCLQLSIVPLFEGGAVLALLASMVSRAQYMQDEKAPPSKRQFPHHPLLSRNGNTLGVVMLTAGGTREILSITLKLAVNASDMCCASYFDGVAQLTSTMSSFVGSVVPSSPETAESAVRDALIAAAIASHADSTTYAAELAKKTFTFNAADIALLAYILQINVVPTAICDDISKTIQSRKEHAATLRSSCSDGNGVVYQIAYNDLGGGSVAWMGTAPSASQSAVFDANENRFKLTSMAASFAGGMLCCKGVDNLFNPYTVSLSTQFSLSLAARSLLTSSIHGFLAKFPVTVDSNTVNAKDPNIVAKLKTLLAPPGTLAAAPTLAAVSFDAGAEGIELLETALLADKANGTFETAASEESFCWTETKKFTALVLRLCNIPVASPLGEIAYTAVSTSQEPYSARIQGGCEIDGVELEAVVLFSSLEYPLHNDTISEVGWFYNLSFKSGEDFAARTVIKEAANVMTAAGLAFVLCSTSGSEQQMNALRALSFGDCPGTDGAPWTKERVLVAVLSTVIERCDDGLHLGAAAAPPESQAAGGASKRPRRGRSKKNANILSLLPRRNMASPKLPRQRSYFKAASFATGPL